MTHRGSTESPVAAARRGGPLLKHLAREINQAGAIWPQAFANRITQKTFLEKIGTKGAKRIIKR